MTTLIREIETEASEGAGDEERVVRLHTSALDRLLKLGPLWREVAAAPEEQACYAPLVRAELLAFLRSVVARGQFGQEGYVRLSTSGPLTFRADVTDGEVRCIVSGREARDLIILQLIVLLQTVGLHNVRICAAPDCQRMFVKTYRREFCSPRCQQRANKRAQRLNLKQQQERARAARLRRKRGH